MPTERFSWTMKGFQEVKAKEGKHIQEISEQVVQTLANNPEIDAESV